MPGAADRPVGDGVGIVDRDPAAGERYARHLQQTSIDGRRLDRPAGRPRLLERRRVGRRPAGAHRARRRGRRSSTPSPTARTSTPAAARTTPSRCSGSWPPPAPTSGSRSTATPTGSSRSTPTGSVVDGDHIIAICARRPPRARRAARRHGRGHRDDQPRLPPGDGRRTASRSSRPTSATAPCSRRMDAGGYSLGGEQSGHVIFSRPGQHRRRPAHRHPAARRDGADRAAARRPRRRSMTRLPQVLRNVRVAARGRRAWSSASPQDIAIAEIELAGQGRVLVRPSGTEPLVRVMVEAPTAEQAVGGGRPPGGCGRAHLRGALTRGLSTPMGAHDRTEAQRPEWVFRIREVPEPHMCGIIGVTRRPSDRLAPSSAEILALVERAAGAAGRPLGRRPRPPDHRSRRTTSPRRHAAAGRARRRGAARRPQPRLVARRAARRGRVDGRPTIESDLDHGAALRSPDLEAVNAALVRLKDAAWAVAPRPPAHGARAVAELAGTDPSAAAIAGVHVHPGRRCRRSTASRCAAATRPASTCSCRPRPRPRVARRSPRSSPPASSDPLFASDVGPRRRAGASASSTRRRPRSASSATTPRPCGAPSAGDDAAAARPRRRAAPRRSCSATPAGRASGIISAAQRPPAQRRGARPGRRAVRRRPRSTATSTTSPTSRPASGLRIAPEITTDAKVIPTLVVPPARPTGADVDEAFRRTVAALRRLGRHRAPAPPTRPADLLLALRGSGQALYVGLAEDAYVVASRALRRRRGVRPVPAPRRRDAGRPSATRRAAGARSSCSTARRAGTLEGIRRSSYDGTRAARRATTSSQRPRSPPATSTAATTRTSSSRRSPRRRPRSARRCGASSSTHDGAPRRARSGPRRCPADLRDGLSDGTIARVIVIGQGTAAVAGQAFARTLERGRAPAPASAVEADARHRALRLRAAHRHERHARRRHQPVGHDHRHEPHRRPRAGPRRRASSPSSTGAAATSPTSPTACSTPPTGATWR